MLLCKGRGCQYRKVCSRYVLGCAIDSLPKPTAVLTDGNGNDTWMDHCTNAKKFMRIGNAQVDNGKQTGL